LVAGVGNNGVGVTGVAPRAHLAGVRLIAAPTTDNDEATGLTYQNNNQAGQGTNQIFTNSWGPADDGYTLQGPGPLTRAALADAVTNGRGGKGSIFTWAAGNGGVNDNSNYDGYANSRYVIAVAASTNSGTQASYSERGANLFINAPSSGGSLSITTTDRVGTIGYNTSSSSTGGDYTNSFGGTSAAAPIAAGAIALMLEANPNLTWRDVKHILVRTAQKNSPGDTSWTTNAAGWHHSDKFGFGRIDAAAAATMAATWTNVGPEVSTSGAATPPNPIPIPDGTGTSTPVFGAFATSTIDILNQVKIEEVEVTVNVTHPYRGDLEFQLVAPTGTTSILGTVRPDDGADFDNWTFTTVRDWDELAQGTWTLKVHDGFAADVGTLNSWSITAYGTSVVPEPGIICVAAVALLYIRRSSRVRFSGPVIHC
jgi:subtilisin-like proprotein convertase family protein